MGVGGGGLGGGEGLLTIGGGVLAAEDVVFALPLPLPWPHAVSSSDDRSIAT